MDETPAPPLASPEDYGARPPDPAPEPVSGAANGHQRPNPLTSIPDSWARPPPIEED